MMKHPALFAAALLCLVATVAVAQVTPGGEPIKSPAGSTTTESVLKEKPSPTVDLQPGQPTDPSLRVLEPEHFGKLQRDITDLRFNNPQCPQQYHVAKAQAWLNFSRDQYHERAWQKDIQGSTFNEARRIVEALKAGQDPGMDTPLVSGSQKIRPDLWAIAQANKANPSSQLCCVQAQTAFCEVQLVWSGHALANLGGWRRANPHVRMAEDLCQEARQVCPPAPPKPIAKVPAPPVRTQLPPTDPPKEAVPPKKITLATDALFKHGKSSFDQMLPAGRAELDKLVADLRQIVNVERMLITGHADVTNGSNDKNLNDRLSLERANAVRSYLSRKGADMSKTEVASAGDRMPIKKDCPIPKGSNGIAAGRAGAAAMRSYYDCLQPNRRVEIEIFGTAEKR